MVHITLLSSIKGWSNTLKGKYPKRKVWLGWPLFEINPIS